MKKWLDNAENLCDTCCQNHATCETDKIVYALDVADLFDITISQFMHDKVVHCQAWKDGDWC